MKFSVLSLLLATGYVALLVASFKQPESVWRVVASIAWLAVIGMMVANAFNTADSKRAAFGRVALTCVAIYLLLVFVPNGRFDWLPHSAIARMYLMWGQPEGYALGPDGNLVFGDPAQFVGRNPFNPYLRLSPRYEPEPFVALCAAQLFGLVTGAAAAWKLKPSG